MGNENDKGWLWGPFSRSAAIAALVALVVDQVHKWWMLDIYGIEAKGRVAVAPFLDLVFVKNKGISYSFLNQESFTGQVLLATFALLASLAMWVWVARAATSKLMALSLGLIIGGAIGNAIDRLVLGGVADFFSLHAFGYYWYIFNIADMAIVAGVAGLLYESFWPSRNDAAKPL